MIGNLKDTMIVGFASTVWSKEDGEISSLQPIYFSKSAQICDCLSESASVARDTIKLEPPPENESFLDRLTREGKLDAFVNLMIFGICLVILIALVVCILCYVARSKPLRRQHAFDAFVYIDLAAKTAMRVRNMEDAILNVKKNGFNRRQSVMRKSAHASGGPASLAGSEMELQSIGN